MTLPNSLRFFFFSAITFLLSTLSVAQSTYQVIAVHDGGSISGVVRLEGKASTVEKMAITKDTKCCGKEKPCPRLELGRNDGVANAIVFLDGIGKGKKKLTNLKPVLSQHNCEYSPHVMVVPVGAQLTIVNNDPVLHNVHAYEGVSFVRTIFNIAQPIKGQRTSIRQTQLTKPGFVSATCDAGHPWMDATILAVEHPYYAITGKDGKFKLDNIPPGTYTLKMWHEGVNIASKQMDGTKVKKYVYEEPYEQSQQIIVKPEAASTANFTLTLR